MHTDMFFFPRLRIHSTSASPDRECTALLRCCLEKAWNYTVGNIIRCFRIIGWRFRFGILREFDRGTRLALTVAIRGSVETIKLLLYYG